MALFGITGFPLKKWFFLVRLELSANSETGGTLLGIPPTMPGTHPVHARYTTLYMPGTPYYTHREAYTHPGRHIPTYKRVRERHIPGYTTGLGERETYTRVYHRVRRERETSARRASLSSKNERETSARRASLSSGLRENPLRGELSRLPENNVKDLGIPRGWEESLLPFTRFTVGPC